MSDPFFGVLGTLVVSHEGRQLRVRSRRQRIILVELLLSPGQVVAVDRLVDAVWGYDSPLTARNQVQICVSTLRRLLGEVECGSMLITTPQGYRLDVPAGSVDLFVFRRWSAEAAALAKAGDRARASALLQRAIGLSRGPLAADADSLAFGGRAARFAEELLAAEEIRCAWELELGRHAELIGELAERVERHPLRERPRAQLMTALCRSGRAAEALAVYREGRRVFVEQLGLEPGPELRDLEARILVGDLPGPAAAHDPAIRERSEPTARVAVPRQLPMDVVDFAGRRASLDEAARLLCGTAGRDGQRTRIVVLTGAAGSGKSALAVRLGHRLMDEHFPDGQICADLKGGTAAPTAPDELLRRFLRALGVAAANVPDSVEECAGLYRSLLAGRRALIVLDDAANEAQVRPLLPAGSGCAVLITARSGLAGLSGAARLRIGALGPEEGAELLAAASGPERVAAEAAAARRLVELVDGQALALRIVAVRLASRPHWSLRSMVARLAEETYRLDELSHGDLAVRPGIKAAYELLPTVERALLHLLCRIGAEVFGAELAAMALNVDREAAAELLDRLHEVHLVQEVADPENRGPAFRVPGLVRIYVRERTARPNPPPLVPVDTRIAAVATVKEN